MLSFRLAVVTLSLSATLTTAYIWPDSKLDELESLHYDQRGYRNRGEAFIAGLTPCNKIPGQVVPGRSNAADWIRTAYHDMATHNVEDRTGGLDGSIRLAEEQSRPENAGNGFKNTFGAFLLIFNRDASVADVIALGAVMAIEQCGGPKIPYRGGRIDAKEPNKSGVPEPHQSLADHTLSFARQGFTPTEMIALVACGHTIGGVQHSAFPNTVPEGSTPGQDVQETFDTSPTSFNNDIATEYIKQTTLNPLVIGHNRTTNSDARIFSSDGNATMKRFADSPELFALTCSQLFAKMIDTVPAGVLLSEPIEPLPVKPINPELRYLGDGTLELRGNIRFWDMPENLSRKITLHWADRYGNRCAECAAQLSHTPDQVGTAYSGTNHSALWYSIPSGEDAPRVDAATGISKFWFEVNEGDGSKNDVKDQDGVGFPLQDVVVVRNTTCFDTKNGSKLRVDIAVRKDAQAIRVYTEHDGVTPDGTVTLRVTDVPAPDVANVGDWEFRNVSSYFGLRMNVAVDVPGNTLRTAYFASDKFPKCP